LAGDDRIVGFIHVARAHESVGSIRCSFCGKERERVAQIVAGPTPDIAICNECVDLAREIMNEQATGIDD
jgi:hypothetical protein